VPDVDAILKGEDVELPTRSEILYILCTTVLRVGKPQHNAAVAKLINRLADLEHDGMKIGVEISAYLFHECMRAKGESLQGVRSQPSIAKWLQKYANKYLVGSGR
jgi:hypothetical protein